MGERACFYDVLGCNREASKGDIRKAYKRLALQYHPDRNNGSEEASAKFKQVTEAYSVLSDDDKRARYDRFGHAGVQGGGGPDMSGDIFTHFQDLFSDFFGGMGGGFAGRRGGPQRGRDMRIEQRLTLEEAVLGCKKEIELTMPTQCDDCAGTGAADDSSFTNCQACGGRGQVSTARGFIMFTQTCGSCNGEGRIIQSPCATCDGVGWEEKTRKVTVSFPPGIDAGHRLRVTGQGLPGPHGGPPGNLYVDVDVERHERYERDGNDLITREAISYTEAALGTEVEIRLLDGSAKTIKVKAGTQPGSVITVPKYGAPAVNGHGRGSLHVVVQVRVPRKVSRKAKKLLRELEQELA